MENLTTTTTTTAEPKKKISRTARFARAHKFLIYEVTDPELRSQLCYYRNMKNLEDNQQEQTDNQDIESEEVDA